MKAKLIKGKYVVIGKSTKRREINDEIPEKPDQ